MITTHLDKLIKKWVGSASASEYEEFTVEERRLHAQMYAKYKMGLSNELTNNDAFVIDGEVDANTHNIDGCC